MAKYTRFEDLPVWIAAADLAERTFTLTQSHHLRGKGDLANQLQRAALSISNNIAEGFQRGTTQELLTFLYYARGSAGEVRSMLTILERMATRERSSQAQGSKSEISNPKSEISNFKSEISNLKSLSESISRQLRAWADALQNTEIKGPRHMTDASRQAYETRRKAEALDAKLNRIVTEARAHGAQRAGE
ncbi:MAG: four helix bundle protein [Phycisphaeraceae bacterium]|nr:MAG: four helix bundle protein [Phycisphaeraceae bacterium]